MRDLAAARAAVEIVRDGAYHPVALRGPKWATQIIAAEIGRRADALAAGVALRSPADGRCPRWGQCRLCALPLPPNAGGDCELCNAARWKLLRSAA